MLRQACDYVACAQRSTSTLTLTTGDGVACLRSTSRSSRALRRQLKPCSVLVGAPACLIHASGSSYDSALPRKALLPPLQPGLLEEGQSPGSWLLNHTGLLPTSLTGTPTAGHQSSLGQASSPGDDLLSTSLTGIPEDGSDPDP